MSHKDTAFDKGKSAVYFNFSAEKINRDGAELIPEKLAHNISKPTALMVTQIGVLILNFSFTEWPRFMLEKLNPPVFASEP